jgi:hypothetical protein
VPYIDSSQDTGQSFTLVAVATNLDASNALIRASQTHHKGTDAAYVDALPVGSFDAGRACVVRT